MKYLALALSLVSVGAFADANGTATNTSTNNYVENTTAATFVQPLTMGGGDNIPFYNTLTNTSATCATNQLVFEAANTTSRLRGSGAPNIGNYGYAIGAKVIMPWGDDGKCEARMAIINRSAELEYARNTHNLCLGSAQSFKQAGVYLTGEYYDAYPEMRKCRVIFTLTGISYKQP